MPRYRGTNRVSDSPTHRRLTRLAKLAGASLSFTPSDGGVTSEGNRAEWAWEAPNGAEGSGDAASVRRGLQALLELKNKPQLKMKPQLEMKPQLKVKAKKA